MLCLHKRKQTGNMLIFYIELAAKAYVEFTCFLAKEVPKEKAKTDRKTTDQYKFDPNGTFV
jgi:hypothetical protein